MFFNKLLPKKCCKIRNFHTCQVIFDVNDVENVLNEHIYLKSDFKNHHELAVYLKNNLLYKSNDIIAINKPYGVKRYKETEKLGEKPKITITTTAVLPELNDLSLQETLPYLSAELSVPQLVIVKSPERFTSGVCLLTTSEQQKKYLERQFTGDKDPEHNFMAVCIGTPATKSFNSKLALKLETNSTQKKATLVDKWSRNSVQYGSVKQVRIYHDTICSGENEATSLVQVATSRTSWHCLRVYLSTRALSPVLGDHIHGSRVQCVQGVPVLVNPWNPVSSQPQKLSKFIREKLQLKNLKDSIVPAHTHLAQLRIPNILENKQDLLIQADPPEYFMWTCQALNLDISNFNYDILQSLSRKKVKEKYSTRVESEIAN